MSQEAELAPTTASMRAQRAPREINGFPAEYHSDGDGDRYVIVDADDHDLVGWSVEVAKDEAWRKRAMGAARTPKRDAGTFRRQFTRTHPWYRSNKGSPWGHFDFRADRAEYPWSAMVDHGEEIIRWIPPETSLLTPAPRSHHATVQGPATPAGSSCATTPRATRLPRRRTTVT
jgi:hypothetical protein